MKIIDTRDGTTLEGDCVTVFPANEPVSERDMLRFYNLRPYDRAYDLMTRPCQYDRVVLQRGDVSDHHFYIVPKYDFYRAEA